MQGLNRKIQQALGITFLALLVWPQFGSQCTIAFDTDPAPTPDWRSSERSSAGSSAGASGDCSLDLHLGFAMDSSG